MKDEYWYILMIEGGDPVFVTSTRYLVQAWFEPDKAPKDFGTRLWAEEVADRLERNNHIAFVVSARRPIKEQPSDVFRDPIEWSLD